jgi:hypothetical protein
MDIPSSYPIKKSFPITTIDHPGVDADRAVQIEEYLVARFEGDPWKAQLCDSLVSKYLTLP